MTDVLSPVPKFHATDNNGNPAVGYQLFTYQAGTSTKLSTYTNSGGGTANDNPTILDYRGEANIWIPPNVSYKYVLAPPTDTDPPSNAIWTVDNVVNSQLLTLFGGVDTGSANAYVLTFDANFSAYTDGIVIYWIPANTNTGASTINVNGLGAVPIVNQDGSALYLGQLTAGQFAEIAYNGSSFYLISFKQLPTINTQDADYTFVLGDANNIVRHTDNTNRTYTIPTNSTAAFPVGTSIEIINQSSYNLTISPAIGVTFYPFGSGSLTSLPVTIGVGTSCYITKTDTNTWIQSTLTGISYQYSSFTATTGGLTAIHTGPVVYRRVGENVSLYLTADLKGTSNSTDFTFVGIPSAIRPAGNRIVMSANMVDNGAQTGGWATVQGDGTVVFGTGINGDPAGFTNTGTKGLAAGWNIIYTL